MDRKRRTQPCTTWKEKVGCRQAVSTLSVSDQTLRVRFDRKKIGYSVR